MRYNFQCILAGLILFAFMNECVAAGKIISPEMSILFRIVDDAGNHVPNVSCRGWIRQFDVKGGGRSYSLTSDANGVVAINAKCSVSFTAFFSKEGYYMSRLEPCLDADGAGSAVVDGKWQPYGETRTVVLKKIRNPGALKVPQSLIRLEVDVPAYGEWLPFDLERFVWVAPRGSGSRDDVLLRFRRRVTEKWNDFKYEMDVTFTNNPLKTWYNTSHEVPRDTGDSSARGILQDVVRADLVVVRICRHGGLDQHSDSCQPRTAGQDALRPRAFADRHQRRRGPDRT